MTGKVTAAGTQLGNSQVIETNLTAPNGVRDVIDQVLLPPAGS